MQYRLCIGDSLNFRLGTLAVSFSSINRAWDVWLRIWWDTCSALMCGVQCSVAWLLVLVGASSSNQVEKRALRVAGTLNVNAWFESRNISTRCCRALRLSAEYKSLAIAAKMSKKVRFLKNVCLSKLRRCQPISTTIFEVVDYYRPLMPRSKS